jgi:putative flippase GtrA
MRLSAFAALSGIGWLIDFTIFNVLVASNNSYLKSNIVSASVAVVFVFITARRFIFLNHVGSLKQAVTKYVVWNAFAIVFASYFIKSIASGLVYLGFNDTLIQLGAFSSLPINRRLIISNIAKLLVTPLTMYANFIAMGYIFERRLSLS